MNASRAAGTAGRDSETGLPDPSAGAVRGPHFPAPAPTIGASAPDTPSAERRVAEPSLKTWLAGTAELVRWELRSLWTRPSFYVLLLAAVLAAAWGFGWLVTLLSRGGVALRSADDPLAQFLGPNVFLVGFCTLVVPLLTMNLASEERRRGTWEALLASPVTPGQALWAKFLSAWWLALLLLSPWLALPALLRYWIGGMRTIWGIVPWPQGPGVPFDPALLWGGGTGLALLAGTFVAAGLVCSALCRRPAAAALMTAGALCGALAASVLPRVLELWGVEPSRLRWLEAISCWGALERFSQGVILPRVIAGQISWWCIAVALAIVAVERVDRGAAWRSVPRQMLGRGFGALALLVAGLNAAAWMAPGQIDLTQSRSFTLAPQTTQLLRSLRDPVEVVLLAPQAPRTAEERRFAQAAAVFRDVLDLAGRASPLVRVSAHDPADSDAGRRWLSRYPDLKPPCVLVHQGTGAAEAHEALYAGDLAEFHGGPGREPGVESTAEQALAGALARLASGRKPTIVYSLTGHGELSLDDDEPHSPLGLGTFAEQCRALDIELRPLDLRAAGKVPADAGLVLLAGGGQPLADPELEALRRYWNHGGRGLVLCDLHIDPGAAQAVRTGIEGLLAEYGLVVGDDRVVLRAASGGLESAAPASPAIGEHPLVRSLPGASVLLYECRSVRAIADGPRSAHVLTPLLVSHAAPLAWAEGDLRREMEPEPGGEADLDGPVAMAQLIERRRGGALEPALVVVGDAEFLDNRALSAPQGRAGLHLSLACIDWLRGESDRMADIPPRRRQGYRLVATATQLRGLVWKPTALVATLIVAAGLTVWLCRRDG